MDVVFNLDRAGTAERTSISLLAIMSECMLSCFSRVQLFSTLWTVACQVPLSLRFSRQESWSGLPCPSPGIFPTWDQTGICLHLLHCRQILYPLSYLGTFTHISIQTQRSHSFSARVQKGCFLFFVFPSLSGIR